MSYEMKFAFEDGSSGYLAHYGVKGMKWGVWNAETKARRSDESSAKKNFEGQKKAVTAASANAIASLVASGGNPFTTAAGFSSAYVATRAAGKAINIGKPLIEKMVKDPEKREKAERRFESRVNSAAIGTIGAAKTFVQTGGNVPLAAASFGLNYAANRISQNAVNAGKPLIDKLVKNPNDREFAYAIANIAVRSAVAEGLTVAGSAAVASMLYQSQPQPQPTWERPEYMLPNSAPGNLIGYGSPEQFGPGTVQQPVPGHGLSDQLYSANIPESLLRQK